MSWEASRDSSGGGVFVLRHVRWGESRHSGIYYQPCAADECAVVNTALEVLQDAGWFAGNDTDNKRHGSARLTEYCGDKVVCIGTLF